MHRRRLLQTLPATAALGLAGCISGDDPATATEAPTDAETTSAPTTTPEGPTGIYVQTFIDEMVPAGMGTEGDVRAMLMLSIPHNFWNINGTEVQKTPREDADSFHLMATVFDPETKTVLPSSASTELTQDGETVSQEVTYPMLSQRMGFHYGANFQVADFGTYTARVAFEGMNAVERTGAFDGRFGERATVEIEFDWTQSVADQFSVRDVDQGGNAGAVKPMDMDAPQGVAPDTSDLPGEPVGSALADGARLVTRYVPDGGRFTDEGDYLYVSARTRYNGFFVPMLGLDAVVERDGDTVAEGRLAPAIDDAAGYHYGLGVDALESGDAVTVRTTTPAQVARHEGYERAFRQMPDVSFTIDE
jgi:uncharacterized protein involved in high-affinity Fe2+ transport